MSVHVFVYFIYFFKKNNHSQYNWSKLYTYHIFTSIVSYLKQLFLYWIDADWVKSIHLLIYNSDIYHHWTFLCRSNSQRIWSSIFTTVSYLSLKCLHWQNICKYQLDDINFTKFKQKLILLVLFCAPLSTVSYILYVCYVLKINRLLYSAKTWSMFIRQYLLSEICF